jgi:serine/threonine protein phosphatase PrpC
MMQAFLSECVGMKTRFVLAPFSCLANIPRFFVEPVGLCRAFLITDMQSKQHNIGTSGATAVSVLLAAEPIEPGPDGSDAKVETKDRVRKMYVANVGDSRAVLVSERYPGKSSTVVEEGKEKIVFPEEDYETDAAATAATAATADAEGSDATNLDATESVVAKEGQEASVAAGGGGAAVATKEYIATRLTFDHSAENPEEQQRIKAAGGFVTRNRVLGILAVSRSFGDHGMKDFVIGKRFYFLSLLLFRKHILTL